MPPILPRKRLRSDSPGPNPPKRTTRHPPARRRKQSVFQDLDAPPKVSRTLSQAEALLHGDGDSSGSSDTESSENEFEDVYINGVNDGKNKGKAPRTDDHSESDEEDWEDALGQRMIDNEDEPLPEVSGDLALTISTHTAPPSLSMRSDGKKGPTKIQRHIRNITHCMHVQFLMFHNLVRNSWIEDKTVQRILVDKLTVGCWRAMDLYWKNAGIQNGKDHVVQATIKTKSTKDLEKESLWEDTGTTGVKVYGGDISKKTTAKTSKSSKSKTKDSKDQDRKQRDWGSASDRLEPGQPNLSAGDPLLRLLKYLSAFWKGTFTMTTPCLRKRGYLAPAVLEAEINAWKHDPNHPELFGERIENIEAFRQLARECKGSRDVGEQLFSALLRGLGIEARMIVSLQPVGFTWNQAEEGEPRNLEKVKGKSSQPSTSTSMEPGPKMKKSFGTRDSPINLTDDDSSDLSSVISLSSDSEVEHNKPIRDPKAAWWKKREPKFPTYWTEVISHLTHTPIVVSVLSRNVITSPSNSEKMRAFYCNSTAADHAKQVFAYLIAFSSDGTAKDVTTRYLPNRQWPGRTKGARMPVEKVPIHNKRGKVKKWEEFDWFKSVMRPYARSITKRKPWDEIEDEGDLVPKKPEKPKGMDEEGGRETLQGYKNSKEYVLERHLRREEALNSGAKVIRHFITGKGENEKAEPVYSRKDVVSCKTVESWHKEGRAIKEGEQPLKYVPMRAVTVTRKREIEERERLEGEKVKQGLYSKAQTDWIIPDPIQDGKIPRNAFGNIDVYVPTMIPKGAVHIPLRGTARVCRKLGVDYAEACTGFEFGKQRAVPVLTGVVVAAENEDFVIDAWETEEAAKAAKEKDKREKLVLGLWKKFYGGLRIVERMKREYGDDVVLPAPKLKPSSAAPAKSEWETFKNHTDFEGGFLREDPGPSEHFAGGFVGDDNEDTAGGFFPASQDSQTHHSQQVELTIDHGEQEEVAQPTLIDNLHQAPISLHSAIRKPNSITDAENQDSDTSEEHDSEYGDEIVAPRRNPRTRGKAPTPRGRGRGRGRGTRHRSTTRSNIHEDPDEPDEESSSLSDAPSPSSSTDTLDKVSADEAEHLVTTSSLAGPKVPTPIITKPTPKRRAARKSVAQVKSHFFASDNDEETDLTDRSPQKNRGRGGGQVGRGRGRGRSRGRGGRGGGRENK